MTIILNEFTLSQYMQQATKNVADKHRIEWLNDGGYCSCLAYVECLYHHEIIAEATRLALR